MLENTTKGVLRQNRYGTLEGDRPVSAAGKRLLLSVAPEQEPTVAVLLTVVVNWAAGLMKKQRAKC